MSNHLSQDQFSKCIVGQPTSAELKHIGECPQCSAELERFGNTLSRFRSAIRERIDDRLALHAADVTSFSIRPAAPGVSKWRWALGAVAVAVFFLGMLPFFTSENSPQQVSKQVSTKVDPDAIMDRMNLHLSRIVPAPMEPVMSLLPNDESTNESGGVQ